MSKKQFVRDAAKIMMLHPFVLEQEPQKRCDAAITLSEALWDRMKDRGYGEAEKQKSRMAKNHYSLIKDQEYFDKCWAKYGREGVRDKAAKAWLAIEESEKPKIFDAICRYLEQLGGSGKAKAHFSTWLNERRWEAFEKTKTVTNATKMPDPLQQQIRHYEAMIKGAQGENKTLLEAQLQALRERQRAS